MENSSNAPKIIEISWEVCNKVGGIYTVIRSKAPAMLGLYGDNYLAVGPYRAESAAIEFEEHPAPEWLQPTLTALTGTGITAHYGRWLIPGKPQALLIEYRRRHLQLDQDKYTLWKDHGISSPQADTEVNEAIAFGFACTDFLKFLSELQSSKIVAQFHEWQVGVPVPRIAHLKLPIATVFTTHATLLGRYRAADNPHFYEELEYLHADEAAERYNIKARHAIEKAAAHAATVFTTISDITAREAKYILGRQADVITPNGLNIERFTALHEFQNLHLRYKERIHEFVMGHFFPSYTFDLDRTLYVFTSGRYEYRNKGMDVFIEGLYQLNQRLKALNDPPTVVAFIVTQAATKNINVQALQNHLMFDDLKNICSELQEGSAQRLLSSVVKRKLPTYDELLPHDFQIRLKRTMYALKSHRLPSIVTHDMLDDGNDAVLRHLRHRGLFNSPADPVKVVFHPEFINATSPLFGLDYDQFVRGCHLGIFPSYYEPWGYTPLECLALGLPAVTTDLAGFGSYVQSSIPRAEEQGVHVLKRNKTEASHTIDQLTQYLVQFCQLSRRERIELRNRAERLSEVFSWNSLVEQYHKAQDESLVRKFS